VRNGEAGFALGCIRRRLESSVEEEKNKKRHLRESLRVYLGGDSGRMRKQSVLEQGYRIQQNQGEK
jgi:hypothetical protein